MKHFSTLFILVLLISSCSVYQKVWDTLFSSDHVVVETDCSELKSELYNGFYEPKEGGRVFENISNIDNEKISFEKTPILSFNEIKSVTKSFDKFTGKEVVNIILTDTGRKIFKIHTANHIGEKLGIIFNDKLITAPVINSEISGGKVQITNGYGDNIEELYTYLKRAIECKGRSQ